MNFFAVCLRMNQVFGESIIYVEFFFISFCILMQILYDVQ